MVTVVLASIVLVFGEQIGWFAGLSPGSWPHHVTGALLSGALANIWYAYFVFWVLLGFMFIADNYGSWSLWKELGKQLALVREQLASLVIAAKCDKGLFFLQTAWVVFGIGAIVAIFGWFTLWFVLLSAFTVLLCRQTAGYQDLFFWIWLILGASLVLALAMGLYALLFGFVVLLFLLTIPVIGAIRSPVRQVPAMALVALSMGLGWGFHTSGAREVTRCWYGELVMRSGEHLACSTWKKVPGLELIVAQGPAANRLVWIDDLDPASWQSNRDYWRKAWEEVRKCLEQGRRKSCLPD